jgi:hypothetical protein
VANLADTFLSIANGARSAGDAVKAFFQQFIADLLRLQTISAFNALFGGAFQGLFSAVNPVARSQGGPIPDMPKLKGFASGGLAATDTVPAMLTPGEFVMSKGAVDAIGADNLAAMNSGRARPGGSSTVNVQFAVNAVDARSVTDLLAEDGKQLARVIGYAFSQDRNLRALVRGQS